MFFLVIFILADFVFATQIDAVSFYALYWFEALLVLAVFAYFKGIFWMDQKQKVRWLSLSMLTAFLGAGSHILSHQMALPNPFDFENPEVLLFLLLIGPVLEEFVFHGALWRLLETFIQKKWILITITALFFAYAHYRVIDTVPEELRSFIQYQGAYALVLGGICGVLRSRYGLVAATLAHLFFNFGFWLAR